MRNRWIGWRRLAGIMLAGTLVCAPMLISISAQADEIDNQKTAAEQQLAQLAAERAQLDKNLEGTTEKLHQAALALHDVEVRIPAAKTELANAREESQAAAEQVTGLAQQLADAEAELAQVQQVRAENQAQMSQTHKEMAALARQVARGKPLSVVGLITRAQSAAEFVNLTTTNAAVARAQSRTLATVQNADAIARDTEARVTALAGQITELKAQAETALGERQMAEQAAAARTTEITELYAKQSRLTAEIESQRDAELQEIQDNIADQAAIAETIRELAAQQSQRDRVIAEKRHQEAVAAYEKCLAEAKAAADSAQTANNQTGSEATSDSQPSATTPAPTVGPASTVDPAPAADPAVTCAALDPGTAATWADTTPSFSGGLGWPTDNHTVTSSYGWRFHPTLHINRLHAGTDLRAQCGVPIYAAQSGLVVKREWYGTGGNMVLIDHGKDDAGDSVMTRYLHLSAYNVSQDQWVAKGQVIGYSGMTGGVSTGCHLHFEVYVNSAHVDPITRLP